MQFRHWILRLRTKGAVLLGRVRPDLDAMATLIDLFFSGIVSSRGPHYYLRTHHDGVISLRPWATKTLSLACSPLILAPIYALVAFVCLCSTAVYRLRVQTCLLALGLCAFPVSRRDSRPPAVASAALFCAVWPDIRAPPPRVCTWVELATHLT